MTQKKRWWLALQSNGEVTLMQDYPDGPARLKMTKSKDKQMPYPPIMEVSLLSEAEKKDKTYLERPVKFNCQQGKKIILDKAAFEYNRNAFSKAYKEIDLSKFVENVNKQVMRARGKTSSGADDIDSQGSGSSPRPPSSSSSSSSSGSDEFDDLSDLDSSEQGKEGDVDEEAAPSDDEPMPGVRTGSQQASTSNPEDTTPDSIKKILDSADTGTVVSVDVGQLDSGSRYLRDTYRKWVDEIKKSMIEFPSHAGAPLVAIASEKNCDFDMKKPNLYRYTVVGGCHQLMAIQELNQEQPTNKFYQTRLVHVFGKELESSDDAISFLANQHNTLQSMHSEQTTQDKVKFCRTHYLGKSDDDNKEWKDVCLQVLKMKRDGLSKIIFCLASLAADVYAELLVVFGLFENGELKQQKLPAAVLNSKKRADMKPHKWQSFSKIKNASTQLQLLKEFTRGLLTEKEFVKECALVAKRQDTQEAFKRVLNVKNWKEAEKDYPTHTTSAAIDRFGAVNLKRSKPETWDEFCKAAKEMKGTPVTDLPPQSYKVDKCRAFVGKVDVAEMASNVATEYPGFKGADLTLINIDNENLSTTHVRNLLGELRNINLSLDKRVFLTVVFTGVESVGEVVGVFRKEKYTHVEVVYVHQTPGKMANGKALLKSATSPAIIGVWSSHQAMPPPTTLISREQQSSDLFTGERTKAPFARSIIGQMINTFSSPHQWVFTINMKLCGDAAAEALQRKRNCVESTACAEEERHAHDKLHKMLEQNQKDADLSSRAPSNPEANSSSEVTDSERTLVTGDGEPSDDDMNTENAQESMTLREDDENEESSQ